jgi:phage terminase large subunit
MDFTIRADCARPETISFLSRQGFNIIGCPKWSGSIEDGISFLLGYTLVIHPRCKLIQKELRLHSYKVDKGGEITRKMEDKWNNAIDSLRYALNPFIQKDDYEEPEATPDVDVYYSADAWMG